MVITYYGKQFFKVQYGDTVLAFNPISKASSSGNGTRFGASVALSTIHLPDYDGVDMVSHGDTVPFVIDGPGDYEVSGIFIKGVALPVEINGKKYINTIYSLKVDSIQICFLGYLADGKILAPIREEIEDPDILFAPVGGHDGLTASDAYKLAISFEPKIIIPMDGEDKSSMNVFLKEGGVEKGEVLDKLTIKRKDLEGKEGEIVVLSSQA